MPETNSPSTNKSNGLSANCVCRFQVYERDIASRINCYFYQLGGAEYTSVWIQGIKVPEFTVVIQAIFGNDLRLTNPNKHVNMNLAIIPCKFVEISSE